MWKNKLNPTKTWKYCILDPELTYWVNVIMSMWPSFMWKKKPFVT